MPKLSQADFSAVVRVLQNSPLLQTHRGRLVTLQTAGLSSLIPQVDLEGPSAIVLGDLVAHLQFYGSLPMGGTALGAFLNSVKETYGPASSEHAILDSVLIRYSLMTPTKTSDEPIVSRTAYDSESVQERIIGENTLRDISFLHRALDAARAVALVDAGSWTGTGFLVSESLLLSNNHVLPSREIAERTAFRFNYQRNELGAPEKAEEYRAAKDGVFSTSRDLDYSIVELSGLPPGRWGALTLATVPIAVGSRVNIVQHPAGLPKQVSFQNNFVEYVDERIVQYLTSTMPGSSGSPVFDDLWRAVAIHHAGGLLTEPTTGRRFFRNEGIVSGAILTDLPENIRRRLTS